MQAINYMKMLPVEHGNLKTTVTLFRVWWTSVYLVTLWASGIIIYATHVQYTVHTESVNTSLGTFLATYFQEQCNYFCSMHIVDTLCFQ